MRRRLEDNSGYALILTILVMSLIIALTLRFNASTRSDLHAAVNFREGVKINSIAKSGFNIACAVLHEDAESEDVDSLRDSWAQTETFSAGSASVFDGYRFEVEITDHSGRITINKLVNEDGSINEMYRDLLSRFLNNEEFGLDPEEADNIIDAIKDWIDKDDEVTGFGAENSYYQSLEDPYSCRNGPMESLEELLFVRGVDRDFFYGKDEKPGVSDFLTIYGDGKININTADAQVLMALSDGLHEKLAKEMIAYRENEDNDISASNWYQTVPGIEDVTIKSEVTTSSSHFEIKSKGFKETVSKQVTGMVERKKDSLSILSWKIE